MKRNVMLIVATLAVVAFAQATVGQVLRLANVATVSLPTCGTDMKGGLIYDSTTDSVKVCTPDGGVGWRTVP